MCVCVKGDSAPLFFAFCILCLVSGFILMPGACRNRTWNVADWEPLDHVGGPGPGPGPAVRCGTVGRRLGVATVDGT